MMGAVQKKEPYMEKQRSGLRFLLDNLGWLVGAIGLATLAWYAATSAADPVDQRRLPYAIPIEYRLPEGLIIANKPPTTGQVVVRGLQSAFQSIDARNVRIVADLTNYAPSETPYTIDLVGSLTDVRGATVTAVQPARVTVQLARRAELLKAVTVRFKEEPPIGYTASALPDPTEVLVSGPAEAIARVEGVEARVNLRNRREAFTLPVPLIAVDANGKPIPEVTLTPAEVLLSVDVQQRSDVTEVAVEPRLIGSIPTGYLRVSQVWEPRRIFVRGEQSAIDRLNGILYTEPINLTGKTDTFTQIVRLSLPAGITLPDPQDITVTIEIEPIPGSREFTGILIQPQGLDPADYQITIRPERVNVIVRGPQVVVDGLTADDVKVFAPVAGLAAGTHRIRLQATVADAEITPENVVITTGEAEVVIVARNPTPTPTPRVATPEATSTP